MRNPGVVAVLVMAGVALGLALPALAAPPAAVYYGPSFVTPVSIASGGAINIVLTTGYGSSVVPLPPGSSAPCSGTCTYPQEAWYNSTVGAPGSCFYLIAGVTVADPDGNEYMLGSNVTSGLHWPSDFGGGGSGTHVPPQAESLNVTVGDSFAIPFVAGAGGLSFTSVLANPPNDASPAGPYYWWTVSGNAYGSDLRLDQNSVINPTVMQGEYVIDIEGVVACPTGSETFTSQLFFDSTVAVIVPQTTTTTTASTSTSTSTALTTPENSMTQTTTVTSATTATMTQTTTAPGQTTATTVTETATTTVSEEGEAVTTTRTIVLTRTVAGGAQTLTQTSTVTETQPIVTLTQIDTETQTQTTTATQTTSGTPVVLTTTQTTTGQGPTSTTTSTVTSTTTTQPGGVIVAYLAGIALLAIIIIIILGILATRYVENRRN